MSEAAFLTIRAAIPDDAATLLALVRALATHEGESDAVCLTEAGAREALAAGHMRALLAFADDQPVGLALYFFNFSSWTGRRGLFLEDLYLAPDVRGRGLGMRLLRALAQEAVANGCARMEWNLLTGNDEAMSFYQQIGAARAEGWETWRLEGPALAAMA